MLRRPSRRLSFDSLGIMADIIYSPPLIKLRTELEGFIFSFSNPSATEFLITGVKIEDDSNVCLFFETRFSLIYMFFYAVRADGESKMFLELCDPL